MAIDLEKQKASNLRRCRKFRALNREWVREYARAYRKKNLEKIRAYEDAWRKEHPEIGRRNCLKYRARHRDRVLARERELRRARYATDPVYKLKVKLRNAVSRAVKYGWKKDTPSMQLLGCDAPTLKKVIECQFEPGMTWENHGKKGWHVDHIRPIASFDFTNPDEILVAMHYSNLQPMWWKENNFKRAKWSACQIY
jgi:hypothetical protein